MAENDELDLIEEFNKAEDPDKKTNLLINLCQLNANKEDGIPVALKYAAIASIVTASPRADVCCLLGELYLKTGNLKWAEIWFKHALLNIGNCDLSYSIIYPMRRLGDIALIKGNMEDKELYDNAIKVLYPDFEPENINILI